MSDPPIPKKLWQCNTRELQIKWCEAALLAGKTLSDTGIWVAGGDPPSIIRSLRRKHKIVTVRVTEVDAAGTKHRVPAWKIESTICSNNSES